MMGAFSSFTFAPTPGRRHKALCGVMPVGEAIAYFAVLSDAYLTVDGDSRHVRGFEDLQALLGGGDLQVLEYARARGQLIEGRHELPDRVAVCLASAGTGAPHVRRWVFGASEPIITTVTRASVKDAWAELDFEEVEVGDPSGKWYFRARDDDPLIFLAVPTGPLLDQIRLRQESCREVSGEFEYAR